MDEDGKSWLRHVADWVGLGVVINSVLAVLPFNPVLVLAASVVGLMVVAIWAEGRMKAAGDEQDLPQP